MSTDFINGNDMLSRLRGNDLEEALNEVDKFFLEYRDTLNLYEYVTFGVEIEFEGIFQDLVEMFMLKNCEVFSKWIIKPDDSLTIGGEINSPIMTDKKEYWQALKKICEYLKKRNAITSNHAGGHIHAGKEILGTDVEAWRVFLKTYTLYENVLFRFFYGDKISARKGTLYYASPIRDILMHQMNDIKNAIEIDDIIKVISCWRKYRAVNFQNTKILSDVKYRNTIEFRCPNATVNHIIWQNNINAITKLLTSARLHMIDEEFIDYKIAKNNPKFEGNEYLYNAIDLKSALEFVDVIFDNNYDKTLFLKQYLKNYQDNFGVKTAISAKRMVK